MRTSGPCSTSVSAELARAGALVSFNGKSFDAPLLETRHLFHRVEWIGAGLPHVDVLHHARQFWKRGEGRPEGLRDERATAHHESVAQAFRPAPAESSSCSLIALERQMLGVRRAGDVPGFQIPERYFQFVRSGDATPLAPVLEHNRLDLVTLAALTARLMHLSRVGPDAARDAREALALGRVYARGGLDARACDAFHRAVAMSDATVTNGSTDVRIDSLRALAIALRRARQYSGRRILLAPPSGRARLFTARRPRSDRGARRSSRAPRARPGGGEDVRAAESGNRRGSDVDERGALSTGAA